MEIWLTEDGQPWAAEIMSRLVIILTIGDDGARREYEICIRSCTKRVINPDGRDIDVGEGAYNGLVHSL